VSHLFFGVVLPFAFLGPIAGTGPLLLVTASRRPLAYIPMTFYHVNARERPSIDFHSELPQDQLTLLNSRLNLPIELFAVVGGMGK
jgi:hypothetical protein